MDHTEIDHHGEQHAVVAALRMDLQPALEMISDALHYDEVLEPGQQWTVPILASCGLKGRMIIQLDTLGDCRANDDLSG